MKGPVLSFDRLGILIGRNLAEFAICRFAPLLSGYGRKCDVSTPHDYAEQSLRDRWIGKRRAQGLNSKPYRF